MGHLHHPATGAHVDPHPRIHRQAVVFVSSSGNTPSAETIAKVDRIRLAWESFFLEATDGRMTAVTNLR